VLRPATNCRPLFIHLYKSKQSQRTRQHAPSAKPRPRRSHDRAHGALVFYTTRQFLTVIEYKCQTIEEKGLMQRRVLKCQATKENQIEVQRSRMTEVHVASSDTSNIEYNWASYIPFWAHSPKSGLSSGGWSGHVQSQPTLMAGDIVGKSWAKPDSKRK
jgi:hypothetical protein